MKSKASFYGIPCFYYDMECRLEGQNKFYDFMLEKIAIPVHLFIADICLFLFDFELNFPVKVFEEN